MDTPTGVTSAQKPHRYRCPGCGADLLFEPKGGVLECPYCGRREHIPESAEQVQERSYEEYLLVQSGRLTRLTEGALEITCASCGAVTTFPPNEVAGECAFCGSKFVAQPKSADPTVAPEGVLPFRVAQDDAQELIKKWIASRWFAPNALKKFASHESISGVYLPFWTYDAHSQSYYRGERGEYYYVTETYTTTDAQGKTVTQTRQVRHTRWYSTSGEVERWFDDLLVPATKSLAQRRLAALEPWDLPELRPYEPAYLSGFRAQQYQVDLGEGFELAKQQMQPVIREDVRQDIGGDEQRIHEVATSYSGVTFKHLLLPVYIGAYRFREKVYQVMINARTGEVQGDRPYSAVKIVLFVLLCLLVVGVIVFLAER